jgi:hypothetical protein
MLLVDHARTRMPPVCIVISVLVWTVFAAICFTSWLLATNGSAPDFQETQSNTSATGRLDPDAMQERGRPGRRF